MKRVTNAVGLRPPATFAEASETVALVAGVQQTLTVVDEDLFRQDLAALAGDLDKGAFARLFSGDYRAARKQVDPCWSSAATRRRPRSSSSRE